MKIRALRQLSLLLALSLLLLTYTPSSAGAQRSPGTAPRSVEASAGSAGGNGVLFVENAGQWDAGARYQAWGGSAGTLWLAKDALWLTLVEQPAGEGADDEANLSRHFNAPRVGAASEAVTGTVANVRLSFPGANPHPRLEPYPRLDTIVSYFLGSDPAGWRAAVPVWAGVRYVDLYPGIDLEVGGDGGQVTPRLVARPGADLGPVSLRVEGAEAVSVEGGRLQVSTAAGDLAFPLLAVDGAAIGQAPHVAAAGGVFDVAAPFAAAAAAEKAGSQGVETPTVNPANLLYSTFLGGTGSVDQGAAIAVDTSGRAYVVGETLSSDFPTTPGAFDPGYNCDGHSYCLDIFVARLDAAGSALEYGTFLGGGGTERKGSIAVDAAGRAYVVGHTESDDFPTTAGAYDPSFNGEWGDAFVVRLDAAGTALEYATYLGGTVEFEGETGEGIAVDADGRAYVTGLTWAYDFPTTAGAFDTTFNGYYDAYVARLDATGSVLEYATFLGGLEYDEGQAIALDAGGQAYVVGKTRSSDFPTTPGAFDTGFHGEYPAYDAFVVRLNPAGSALDYGTFIGGSEDDYAYGVAVDGSGRAYVTGQTGSSDFPATPGACAAGLRGPGDAFVARLDPAGSALDYATLLGGSGSESGLGIAVDAGGRACVTGSTASSDFPTRPGAITTGLNGSSDAFVARLNAAGCGLEYATFLGGASSDRGTGIAVDTDGRAYVTGNTSSSAFPTTSGAFDTSYNGNANAFVARLSLEVEPLYLPALFRQ